MWKRFNDIKWLLKYVKKRHKEYKLPDTVPTLNNHVYFKRFEADVITERKLFIIRLLDYIGQHPILYKSQAFQEFFSKGQSMPAEERLQFGDALFDQTAESLEISNKSSESQDSAALSASSSMSESVYSRLTSSRSSLIDGGTPTDQSVDVVDTINSAVDSMMPYYQHHIIDYGQLIETPKMPNQRADLSQFRVLRAFGNVMQVQDTNTKQVYIMKSIYKSAVVDDDTYLPSNFPFMVSLVAYYLSDSSVYLLLEQARYNTITCRLIAVYHFLLSNFIASPFTNVNIVSLFCIVAVAANYSTTFARITASCQKRVNKLCLHRMR